jgi:hypothetical protein
MNNDARFPIDRVQIRRLQDYDYFFRCAFQGLSLIHTECRLDVRSSAVEARERDGISFVLETNFVSYFLVTVKTEGRALKAAGRVGRDRKIWRYAMRGRSQRKNL